MEKRVLIAVDTNVLLDQAVGTADVLDALAVLKRRLPNAVFVVTRTVLEELAAALDDEDTELREAAEMVLVSLKDWGYQAMDVVPVGRGITETIGHKLRTKGVLPEEEVNDASIIAEAALLDCTLLLSSDHHMLDAQEHPLFRKVLKEADVDGESLVIARPRTIASRF